MAKRKTALDQVIKFEKDSPTAYIIGSTSCKRKDLLGLLWKGKGGTKSKPKGHSIYKLGLQNTDPDLKFKGKKGGQIILTGKDSVWKEFADGKSKITMLEVLKLAYKDIKE